MVSRNLEK